MAKSNRFSKQQFNSLTEFYLSRISKQSELFFLGGFFLFAGRNGDLFEATARDFLDER
jgi:hypothetical protein